MRNPRTKSGAPAIVMIPTEIQGVVFNKDKLVCGPDADFTKLAWKTSSDDKGQGFTPLSVHLTTKYFHQSNLTLKKGVHLHWILPPPFTTPVKKEKNSDNYPAVPTAWMVVRFRAGVLEKKWLVQSDWLRETPSPYHEQCIVPIPYDLQLHANRQPYRYMGKTIELDSFSELTSQLRLKKPGHHWQEYYYESDMTDKSAAKKGALTTLGYGNPAFAAYYPNCMGVFGFHDSEVTKANAVDVSYMVVGQYADKKQDLLAENIRGKEVLGRLKNSLQKDWGLNLKASLEAGNSDSSRSIVADFRSQHRIDSSSICFGLHYLDPNTKAQPLLDTSQLNWALGNNSMEALTALLAKDIAEAASTADQVSQVEDMLNSVVMSDELSKGDPANWHKFIELNHAKAFAKEHGGFKWKLVKRKRSTGRSRPRDMWESPGGKGFFGGAIKDVVDTLESPHQLREEVDELNRLQQEKDALARKLQICTEQLYADWYKLMLLSNPENSLDISSFPDLSTQGVSFNEIQEFIGRREIDRLKTTRQDYDELVKKLATKRSKLVAQIGTINHGHRDRDWSFKLQKIGGDNFWVPREPVLLIDGINADLHKQTGPVGALPCYLFIDKAGEGLANESTVKTIFKHLSNQQAYPQGSPGISASRKEWNPFLMDWEVKYTPVIMKRADEYHKDSVKRQFTIEQNSIEFSLKHGKVIGGTDFATPELIRGSTVLSPFPKLQYEFKLAQYLFTLWPDVKKTPAWEALQTKDKPAPEELVAIVVEKARAYSTTDTPLWHDPVWTTSQALIALEDRNILIQHLDGFNKAMEMLDPSLQMPVVDPLGPPPRQMLSRQIAQLVNGQGVTAPIPDANFQPLRTGLVELQKLRLKDNFGLYQEHGFDAGNAQLHAAALMHKSIDLTKPFLMPRVVKPMRINAKFLPARHKGAYNDNPVCGWLMIDELDNSLLVFNQHGQCLGMLMDTGDWQQSPDEHAIETPITINDISNEHLRQVVHWFHKNSSKLSGFIELANQSLANISPASFAGANAMALLVSRPMAVVRASIGFEISGPAVVNQSFSSLIKYIKTNREKARYDNMTHVHFPLRLGDYQHHDDGLVAYWREEQLTNGTTTLSDRLYFPEVSHTGIENFVCGNDTDYPIWRSVKEGQCPLTMLMDLQGVVNIDSGILPRYSLHLENEWKERALKNLCPLFRFGPVLNAVNQENTLLIDVPEEKDFTWKWYTKLDKSDEEQQLEAKILAPSRDARLDTEPELQSGYLMLSPQKKNNRL